MNKVKNPYKQAVCITTNNDSCCKTKVHLNKNRSLHAIAIFKAYLLSFIYYIHDLNVKHKISKVINKKIKTKIKVN